MLVNKQGNHIVELNEEMYYACSKCSTNSKVKWHRPHNKKWYEHKNFINLDETNSNRPRYFWCTYCNKSHDFTRNCLAYKAIVSYKGKTGTVNKKTIQKSHEDVLIEINTYVLKHTKILNWRTVIGRNSLPWKCTMSSRLIVPDLIYCVPNKNLRYKCSITNIIEFETATSEETIIGKVKRFDMSSKKMIEDNAQSKVQLPRIIFLYENQTDINIEHVKNAIDSLNFQFLDDVIVDYYDEEGDWFRHFLKT
ncbi:hypothetical protein Mpsy_2285 [Methanolobus psychrophilus R15]|nr:hypothetical protein Mpsy_2285 [Methanolobus psychrophilus R15]